MSAGRLGAVTADVYSPSDAETRAKSTWNATRHGRRPNPVRRPPAGWQFGAGHFETLGPHPIDDPVMVGRQRIILGGHFGRADPLALRDPGLQLVKITHPQGHLEGDAGRMFGGAEHPAGNRRLVHVDRTLGNLPEAAAENDALRRRRGAQRHGPQHCGKKNP